MANAYIKPGKWLKWNDEEQ